MIMKSDVLLFGFLETVLTNLNNMGKLCIVLKRATLCSVGLSVGLDIATDLPIQLSESRIG